MREKAKFVVTEMKLENKISNRADNELKGCIIMNISGLAGI